MANFRQRSTPLAKSTEASRVREPQQPKAPRTTSQQLLLIFLIPLAFPVFFWWSPFQRDSSLNSYALCSRNGKRIYTADATNTKVQCAVIHNSKFVDVGQLSEVQARWSLISSNNVAKLKVRYVDENFIVVPGISDSHAHILEYGAFRTMPLEPATSVEEAVAVVREHILSNPDISKDKTKWIEGWGWDHTAWPTQHWPTAADLDADPVINGRLVILHSKDGHAVWVSSRAIEISSPFPETVVGGFIVRDAVGKPSGVFLDNAQHLINRPPTSDEVLSKRFAVTVKDTLAVGLTSIHDAGLDPSSLGFFKRQSEKNALPIRIYGMRYFDGDYWGNTTVPLIAKGSGRFNARSVKMFVDGALRTGGAALFEPYADNPGTRGIMRLDANLLNDVIPKFLRDGWQVNVHAIGDRANARILDAFELALQGVNVTALRPRLEHAQLLTEADMKRVGKLGVIASIQPTHVTSDMWYAEDRLGPDRIKGLYAFRSLLDSGARLTFGSDFPVEDINPLAGFRAAISRVSPNGQSPHGPGGWFPNQRLTREEALRGMTIEPAYASFTESILGSIEPGKYADYVILSQDIMEVPVEMILDTKVVATVIDGTPVYGNI